MCRIISLTIVLLIYTLNIAIGQESSLAKANTLATEGNRTEAIRMYEDVRNEGKSSVDLMYNLGTLYLQEKEIGKSILFLERSLKYKPRHSDALSNLEIAKSEIKDPIFAITPFFIAAYWQKFTHLCSMEIWAIFSLIFLAAFVYWTNKVLFGTMTRKQKWLSLSALLTVLIISLAAAFTRYMALNSDAYAIVMSEVDRLEGPDQNSKNEEYPFISEGIKVRIIDSFEDYYKVKLPDSDESWIRKEKLEKI